MSAPLYNAEILRLATSIPHLGRLEHADGSAELRSPVCGSRVIVDVRSEGDRIGGIGLEVHSCALGQASACLLARHAPGLTLGQLEDGVKNLAALLKGETANTDFWPGIEALARAKNYPARHPAILLPFDAAVAAMRSAMTKVGG